MAALWDAGRQIFSTFPEAVWAGILIGAGCSFLGVLVVLKRLVFIGATLSEVAGCGVAAAFFYHVHPFFGAVALTLAAVTILAFSSEEKKVPRDSILATVFIFSSSLAVLLVAKSGFGLEEVKSLLYGDLIITSAVDLKILALIVLPIMGLCFLFLRPIVYTFMDREEAKVLGIQVRFWELFFYYALGILVSAASKLGGMLLVFCYLVIPPMIGLLMTRRLGWAMVTAIFTAVFSTLLGFSYSYLHDLPTNQVIAVLSGLLLGLVGLGKGLFSIFPPRE